MLFTCGSWVFIYELFWKEFESHQRWLTLPVSNVCLWLAPHHTHDSPVFMKLLWTGNWFLSCVAEITVKGCRSPDWVFPHFHVWDWSSQLKSQIVRILLQSFIPCLFSLLVAIKLTPKIVSQGELIVNLRRNCRILFTTRQTSKHLILALLNILQYSVRVPCVRAVTCNTCYSWWTHEMLWVIKVENLRWHRLLMFCEMLQVNLQLAFKLNKSPK